MDLLMSMVDWPAIACRSEEVHRHSVLGTHVSLGGPTAYGDLPPIPERFADSFNLTVWDWQHGAPVGSGYCPARDVVSETIAELGVWEPAETIVMRLCFERLETGVFLDFGCQLGWFSVLAARAGMNVAAFDADLECVNLCNRNLLDNGYDETATMQRIDADATPLDPLDIGGPVVVKIDLEGAEKHAISVIQPIIDSGAVEFVMIEMSPVFNKSYRGIARGLIKDGFTPYEVTPKASPPHRLDTLDDLKPFVVTKDVIENELQQWHQRDLLFVRGAL